MAILYNNLNKLLVKIKFLNTVLPQHICKYYATNEYNEYINNNY